MTNTSKSHEFSPQPSEVLRYLLVWLRGLHHTRGESKASDSAREKSKASDWAMVGLTALGLVAAGFSAVFLYTQLKEAQRSTDAGITNFMLDERAWIQLEPIKPGKTSRPGILSHGPVSVFEFPLYLRNVGKTIAINTVLRAAMMSANYDFLTGEKMILSVQDSLKDVDATVKPAFSAVVAPNTTTPLITSLTTNDYIRGKSQFLLGVIDYDDEFENHHWLRFCYFIDEHSGELSVCGYGNVGDKNPEVLRRK